MRRRNRKPGQGAGLQGASQGYSRALASGPSGDPRVRRSAQALGATDLHFSADNMALDGKRRLAVRKAKAVTSTDVSDVIDALKDAGLMER